MYTEEQASASGFYACQAALKGSVDVMHHCIQTGLLGCIYLNLLSDLERPQMRQRSNARQDLRMRSIAVQMPGMALPLDKTLSGDLRTADAVDADNTT